MELRVVGLASQESVPRWVDAVHPFVSSLLVRCTLGESLPINAHIVSMDGAMIMQSTEAMAEVTWSHSSGPRCIRLYVVLLQICRSLKNK